MISPSECQRHAEIVVGIQDDAIRAECDYGLAAVDRVDLAAGIHRLVLCIGDHCCELHDPDYAARLVRNRVIAGLNPDFPPTLCDALELAGEKLAAAERFPEAPVVFPVGQPGRSKHAVMAAANLVQRIVHRGEKVGVGRQDFTRRGKLDHGHDAIKGGKDTGVELASGAGAAALQNRRRRFPVLKREQ